MSYIEEANYCTLQEYETNKSTRLMPDELVIDDIYVLMMAVKNQKREIAVKWPSTVLEIDPLNSGAHLIRFALLDQDLGKFATCTGKFDSGYWVDSPNTTVPSNIKFREGYFKSLAGEWDDDLTRLLQSLQVPESQQVPVLV